jgi:glycosyltransferase involved in cell wall biosynthesis
MPAPKILQVFSRYEYYGGEESSVYRIGDALQQLFEVEYFLASTAEFLNASILKKAALPLRIFHNSDVLRRLRRFQEIGHFNLWQIHNVFPAMSPAIYMEAFNRGIPIVHYLHNYRFGCANGFLLNHGQPCRRCIHGNFWPAVANKSWHDSRIASAALGSVLYYTRKRGLFEKVCRWIAISHAQKAIHVEMGIPAENIEVIYHFYEKKGLPPKPAPNGHALFIGRLSPEKGVGQLLEAWRILDRKDKQLVIVGEGPELPALQAFAQKNQLSNVVFTGFLPANAQAEVWANAAFSVVPSIWEEPFGMVVLESWANARPVIAHQIGALPELVTPGETGLLSPAFRPDLLAANLDRAFNSPKLCMDMGGKGRMLLKVKFTKAEWREQMRSLYTKLNFS